MTVMLICLLVVIFHYILYTKVKQRKIINWGLYKNEIILHYMIAFSIYLVMITLKWNVNLTKNYNVINWILVAGEIYDSRKNNGEKHISLSNIENKNIFSMAA